MLEVCIDSLESAVKAIHGGANELEVCSSLAEGGLTPSPGLVKQIAEMVDNVAAGTPIRKSCRDCACKNLKEIPYINVMIRCRTGTDFQYSDEEMDTMLSDIDIFKEIGGVDRFVFGALTDTQEIDKSNCFKIIQRASPVPVTFHRAFDVCTDPYKSINIIKQLNFDRLLTSGQKPSASDTEAIQLIKSLVSDFGKKIQIMPGAGINLENVKTFIDIGCEIVHSSCKKIKYLPKVKSGVNMGSGELKNLNSEFIFVTDESIVRKMKDIISNK